jgi:hypothetical protein
MLHSGVDGALMESMYLMGWVSINSSGKVGRCFQDTLDSRWMTAPRLIFGILYDVGITP